MDGRAKVREIRKGFPGKVTLFFLCFLFCFTGFGALADAPEYLDYSTNLRDFGREIAAMNREGAGLLRTSRGEKPVLVLCRLKSDTKSFPEEGLLRLVAGPGKRFVLQYASESLAREAVEELNKQQDVIYAELDGEVQGASEEINFHSQGASDMGFAPYLGLVREFRKGSMTVAVVDSGVSSHSLLSGRTKRGGYDYVDGDTDPTNDLNGHGTHIAGVIADCTSGTDVWIYPIRVLNASANGKISNVAAAVLEAAQAGCRVINLSLVSSIQSEALEDAIRSAISAGSVVVAAAGNSGENVAGLTPAGMNDVGILVVGSAELSNGQPIRASYSNYGSAVDIYACGTDISSCSRSGGYVTQSGTSVAAAHISGACALILQIWPSVDPATVAGRLTTIAGVGEINVPDMDLLVPREIGFSLRSIRMSVGDQLNLPKEVYPDTTFAEMSFRIVEGNSVKILADGNILAEMPGTTLLVASCPVWAEQRIQIDVTEPTGKGLRTAGVSIIEEEALMGTGFQKIELDGSVRAVGDRAFAENSDLQAIRLPEGHLTLGEGIMEGSGQALVICMKGSDAATYAIEHELQYIFE